MQLTNKQKQNLKIVGIFGYKNKNDLGDFIKEIKTDMNEKTLKEYCKKTFKKYMFFSFSWDDGKFIKFEDCLKCN